MHLGVVPSIFSFWMPDGLEVQHWILPCENYINI